MLLKYFWCKEGIPDPKTHYFVTHYSYGKLWSIKELREDWQEARLLCEVSIMKDILQARDICQMANDYSILLHNNHVAIYLSTWEWEWYKGKLYKLNLMNLSLFTKFTNVSHCQSFPLRIYYMARLAILINFFICILIWTKV